jgi:hypothetical protein
MTAWLCLLAALAFAQVPPATGGPAPLVPIAAETPHMDAFARDGAFRAKLLAPGRSDWFLIQAASGDVLLVAQKGYLTAAQLTALARQVQAADDAIPKWGGRRLIKSRYTLYVYDDTLDDDVTPISEADVPGAQHGERGVELRFVKDGTAPLFHELTHLLVGGDGDSQSLSEGLADTSEDHFLPGHAHAFVLANSDPDALCKAALAKYPQPFYAAVGAPGYSSWSGSMIRFDFYYCSWSFTRWLVAGASPEKVIAVLDDGASDAAYQKQLGAPLALLRARWARKLQGP